MKLINYGEILKSEIADKGYSKKRIAKLLSMSYPTLIKRLEDGEFSQSELKKLQSNRYLP